ncbi:DODA-type extradiol aromatic ring-opening family dioxygenase [Gemmobacter lanyuensis]
MGARYPDLRAILVISAHWEDRVNTIGIAPHPETIHDFGGFDPALYNLRYPARTDPAVIDEVAAALTAAGVPHARDGRRGYDHGVWIPLLLAFPQAEVPVIQLSLRHGASARENFALGQALAPLREQGC